MHILLLAGIFLLLLFGPSLWVKRVMAKYAQPEGRYPVTGGELARTLLDRLGLAHVAVEATEQGDHYDPVARVLRLSPDKLRGRSLTAITVAAHEVGHAMQDRDGYVPLRLRSRLVEYARYGERLGAGMLTLAPLLFILTRAPGAGAVMLVGGLLSLGTATLVHLVTLPTEFDASFARALPLLESGQVLVDGDLPHARRLLTAAACTYVAASLASLLNVARWLTLLRR